jgi:hypothetical protein
VYQTSIEIDASRKLVWRILTHGAAMPEWDPGMTKFEGNIGPGEKIVLHVVSSPRPVARTVVAFEPPERMVWKGGMAMGLFQGERTFTLTELGPGKTRFEVRETFSGPLRPLMARMIPDLTEAFEDHAKGLKERAERTQLF